MYPYSSLPQPLSNTSFYILLALSYEQRHAYSFKGAVSNYSLGSVQPTLAQISKTLQKLHDIGFVDMIGRHPAGKSGIPRMHYQISENGAVRLQEEFTRMDHALRIADAAGLRRGSNF